MAQLVPKDVTAALKLIEKEVMRVRTTDPPLRGVYDGYGRLLEDVDGLWDAVKATPRSWTQLRLEAVKVAALAVRFIIDVTNVDDEELIRAKRDARLHP